MHPHTLGNIVGSMNEVDMAKNIHCKEMVEHEHFEIRYIILSFGCRVSFVGSFIPNSGKCAVSVSPPPH